MKKALFFPLQVSLCTVGCLYASSGITQAQVTSDGTVNTQVTQDGNSAVITGGETRGGNLFHSFQDFSVGTGNEAFFNNANDISNIFSRVTGGNISNIDGLIRANGSASLFLINPNGIIFGEGARLDIGGSFYGSSASSILFEDGEFSAPDLENPPLLTVNAPVGLGFRDNPGDIVNRASDNSLQVSPGETIALLGGNVTFDGGGIFAPGSSVEIGGLTETGEISIAEDSTLSFPDGVARGDILLTNTSNLNVPDEGGVTITARNFDLNTNSAIRTGIITNTGSPNAQAADVIINATENVVIDSLNSDNTIINSSVFAEGVGNAGNIEITAKNISLLNGGAIFSGIVNQGNTGDITLTATENITFEGIRDSRQSGIFSAINLEAVGNTGNINLTAQNLSITDGASITGRVFGQGNSGDININVRDSIFIEGESGVFPSAIITEVVGEGDTGDINIATQNLFLSDGAEISANVGSPDNLGVENVEITGNSGDINITAEAITVDGFSSKISSDVLFAQGNGGQLNLVTDSLSLINGGALSASTFGTGNAGGISIEAQDQVLINSGGEILAEIELGGTGNGGNIEINTSLLSIIDSGGAISTTIFSGDGDAGDINITADLITVENSFIDALSSSNQLGRAGSIAIETSQLILSDAAQISVASQGEGSGGDLTINASKSIQLSGAAGSFRGGLVASAVGSGNGGSINITTDELSISDGATIVAGNTPSFPENSLFATGTGQPGNIDIQANSIHLNAEGRIEAVTQSERGEGANINLRVAEDITIRGDSFISARAINQGNGGNLDIDSRFIIAFPGGNNDILASAEQGQGGNISINAESLFGIREGTPNDLSNDISASSEISGLDGTVNIATPDINPVQGTSELPNNIVVPEETAQQACEANRESAAKNGLNITGKGGILPEPGLPLNSLNVTVDGESTSAKAIPAPIETSQGEIQLARGVEITESGEVILTAYRTNNSGDRLPEGSRNCDRV